MRLRPAGNGRIENPPCSRRHVGEPDVLSSNSCGVGGLSRRLLNRAAQRAPSVAAAVGRQSLAKPQRRSLYGRPATAADPPRPRREGPADARDARLCGVAGTDAKTRNQLVNGCETRARSVWRWGRFLDGAVQRQQIR